MEQLTPLSAFDEELLREEATFEKTRKEKRHPGKVVIKKVSSLFHHQQKLNEKSLKLEEKQ